MSVIMLSFEGVSTSVPATTRDGPRGVLSPSLALEACFRGELRSMPFAAPEGTVPPLTGEDRKKSGEEDGTFCRDARGVPWVGICCS